MDANNIATIRSEITIFLIFLKRVLQKNIYEYMLKKCINCGRQCDTVVGPSLQNAHIAQLFFLEMLGLNTEPTSFAILPTASVKYPENR
jgi:hypothetical protein